jgi:hypothetical protein
VSGDARDDERPWEQAGAVRRDCEPHRGDALQLVGGLSATFGVFALALALPPCVRGWLGLVGVAACSFVALPTGLIAWLCANQDLAKMRAGVMHPAGAMPTERARSLGRWGVGLSLVAFCLWVAVGGGGFVYRLLYPDPFWEY